MSTNLAAVTTLTPTLLCSVQVTTTTSTAVYTVPAASGAIIKQGSLCNVTGLLPAPVQAALATATTGGTLAASAYFYVLTSTNAYGETVRGNEQTITTTGTTSTITATWTAVTGATTPIVAGACSSKAVIFSGLPLPIRVWNVSTSEALRGHKDRATRLPC